MIDREEVQDRLMGWFEAIERTPGSRWTLTVLLGAISISLTGAPEADDAVSVFLRLSIPVAIIAIYAWRGYSVIRTITLPALRGVRIGQLADSVYFLGFLWTLWALIDSFVIHNLPVALGVFRAFGYALITTASGMFLRMMILQFSYTSDIQDEAKQPFIEREMARFSSEIDRAVKKLGRFQKEMERLANSLETASSNVNTKADAGIEKIEEHAKEVNKRLADSAISVSETTVNLGDKLKEPLDRLVSSIEMVSERIRNTDVSNVIERSVEQESTKLRKSMQDATKNLQEAIEELSRSVLKAAKQINSSSANNWWDVLFFWRDSSSEKENSKEQ